MLNRLYNYWHSFKQNNTQIDIQDNIQNYIQNNKQRFDLDDKASVLYDSINWKNSVIGGSYALKQFYGNQKENDWKPDDIDIAVGVPTDKEFEKEATNFEKKSGLKLIRYARKDTSIFDYFGLTYTYTTTDIRTGKSVTKWYGNAS